MMGLPNAFCIFVATEVKSTTLGNISLRYIHDSEGNSITNVTLTNFATVEKVLLYVTMKAAENGNDRDYRNTLVQTVSDAEKTFRSMQSNLFMKGFMGNMIKSMDLDLKFPMPPVRSVSNCL